MRKNKNSPLKVGLEIVLLIWVCVILVVGLGILRFEAATLAHELERLNRSIQEYSDEEIVLRQELSGLVAPIKIYSYCKESLGMQKVLKAESLPVRFRSDVVAAKKNNRSEDNSKWRTRLSWLFGNR